MEGWGHVGWYIRGGRGVHGNLDAIWIFVGEMGGRGTGSLLIRSSTRSGAPFCAYAYPFRDGIQSRART